MLLRDAPTFTLTDLSNKLEEYQVSVIETTNDLIQVDIVGDYTVSIAGDVHPLSEPGMKALASWVDIPYKFLERAPADIQHYLLNELLERNPGEARVSVSSYGIDMIRSPSTKFIDPRSLVEIATRVITPEALVVDYWNTAEDFRLDVIVPEGFDRGIGGDRKVGDLTRGGIRMGQNQRANQTNISPWVSEYLYRLSCTNGMEVYDELMKVDARGNSVEEVLAQFEVLADRAFSRVEDTITSFYDLRNTTPDDPLRVARQMARESGLSARTADAIVAEIALMNSDPGPTMFDIVNMITNRANEPELRIGPRRKLERAGGAYVREHIERCASCQARID